MRAINPFCSSLPGSAPLQLLPGAGEGDAPARKDAREGITERKEDAPAAAPGYQRYRRSLRRTPGALGESIGAAPGREGSTTARREPGGLGGGGGLGTPGRMRWSCRDAPAELRRDRDSRDGAAGMEPLRRLRMAGRCGWDGGHEAGAPPDPSEKLSPPAPAPVTAESRPPRGWIGIFFWDQIVPAWAGQARPLGYNATKKPPMNFLGGGGGEGGYGWRCTLQGGMSKPTLVSHGWFPKGGKLGPTDVRPHIPGLWGAGCSWDWLSSELGALRSEQGLGCPHKQDLP